MTDELTPTQALALWGLLARQGRAADKDVKAADRTALVAAGFVEADKPSKTMSLTDRGWNWASERLGAPGLDKQPVLTLFLARLGAHLQASGETLADFIGEAPPLPAPPVKARPASRPKTPSKTKAPPKPKAPELRQMIEDAYLRASGGARSEPVRLSRLRTELGDLDRKTVDAGLARILKAKKETARLTRLSDNKAIDTAEAEAAFVSAADEAFHLIRIQ